MEEDCRRGSRPLRPHTFLVHAERPIWRVVDFQTHSTQANGTGALLPRVVATKVPLKAEEA